MNQIICLCLICLIKIVSVSSCEHDDSCAIDEPTERNIRKERALLFPPSSTIGVGDYYSFFFSKFKEKTVNLL